MLICNTSGAFGVTDSHRSYFLAHPVSKQSVSIYSKKVKVSHTRYQALDPELIPYPGVQAVSPQVTISHPPGGRLLLLSARPAVTFPAAEHHRPLAGTTLYCLVTEAHRCERLAQGCHEAFAPGRI